VEPTLDELKALLDASERRRQVILDTVLDPIISINPHGRIEAVNGAAERVFGYSSAELLGQNVAMLMPEPDRSAHDAYIEAYRVTRIPKIIGKGRGVVAQRKDGTLFPAELTIGEAQLDGETVYTGIIHDTTHRHQAAQELQLTKDRLERALGGTSDGLWEYAVDPTIGKNYTSPRLREMFGIQDRPDLGVMDLLSPEEKTRIGDAIADHLERGAKFEHVFPCTLPTGEIRWFLSRGKAIRNEVGRPLLMAGSVSDITERIEADQELERTRERLELAIEGTSDGIWDWNIVEKQSYDSPQLLKMVGLDQRPDLTLQDLMTEEERLRMNAAVHRHLSEGLPYDHEFPCTLPSGETRWFRTRGEAVRGPDGKGIRMVGSLTDVTDRRRALQALEEMTENLSATIHARTAELRRANTELERAGRAKDSFLASMSHELRTPLNAILGLTEALNEEVYGELNEDQRRALVTIENSGKHLLALISDVLDLAKIHAGRLELDHDPVAVRDLIHACMTYVRRQAEQKRIHLAVTELDPQLVMTTDGRRLRQILINLLANAVKFTPEGGRVTLDVRPRPDDGAIEFRIEDTGIGIPEEFILEIFEPFRQIDSKLSRQYDGTGLGLALVRELIDSFGGSLEVRSEVGRGSEFTVSLPWHRADWSSDDSPTSIRRAMVIGDHSADAESLARKLRELGIATDLVPSGGALTALEGGCPEVVFLDTIFSGEERRELLTHLRGRCRGTPIVVTDPNAEITGTEARLPKPIGLADLSRVLRCLGATAPSPAALPDGDSSKATGIRILLAEDNEANILATGDYLRSHGYEVLVARNGREAVEMARAERPALILMDIQMPVLDGLEAIRRIRRSEARDIPIIALTALAMRADRVRCLEAGADDYLSKPVRLAELRKTIEERLNA
jgi:PAS domain S-box-containing protein